MSRLLNVYGSWLNRRPLITKCVTSSLIAMGGDFVQQTLEINQFKNIQNQNQNPLKHKNKNNSNNNNNNNNTHSENETSLSPSSLSAYSYSVIRTFRFFLFGGLVVAPIFHVWFGALDSVVGRMMAKNLLSTAISNSPKKIGFVKLLIDQTVMAPLFTLIFFVSMGILENLSPSGIWEKTKNGYPQALMGNYVVWPLSQFINFSFIPLQYRVLWLNGTGFGWNAFLSKVNATKKLDIEGTSNTPVNTHITDSNSTNIYK